MDFAAEGRAAVGAAGGSPASRVPDILFEDVLGMDSFDFGDEDLDGQASSKHDSGLGRKAPPMTDEELQNLDPTALARDELIWAVGRAATIKLSDRRLWRGFSKAIAALGESSLIPSEICRLMQAFAYAPKEAPLDEQQLQRLLKVFASRAVDYSDEHLMRLIYGYGKLAAKRGLSLQRFLDFAASEVIERKRMKAWRKLWILRAVGHLPGIGDDFCALLIGQILRDLGDLDAESLHTFVPIMVEHRLHERSGAMQWLNKAYNQKIFCYKTPDLLLRSGLPFVLHDLMKMTTLAAWLSRLHDLRLPITPAMAASAPPLPSQSRGGEDSGDEAGGPSGALQDDAAHARRATKNLEALKVVELCLRHERDPTVVSTLPYKSRHLLTLAQRTPLTPPEDYQMLELPFVFAELGRLFRSLGVLLHPTLHGPYLLELSDPLGRTVVEWDANWSLYPPWRRKAQKDFVNRKHFYLKAEGWRVICVPLAEFQRLEDREAKLAFLKRFVDARGLQYLRLES